MESTGILAIDRQQHLTALTTFGNSGQLNFFTASSLLNGSVPDNNFDTAHLTASASGQPQQIADFLVPETSYLLSLSAKNQLASATSPAPQKSNSDDLAVATDPLTGTRTASQLNLSYPDDSLATARNVVGVENGRVNLSDFLGVGDSEDYYRFTVNSNSDLSLRLDGLSANAGFDLIQDKNSDGLVDYDEFIDGDYVLAGTSGEINFLGLNPGTYYVGVYNYVGYTNYNLTLSATPGTGFNSNYGYGLLDANAAVSRTLNRPTLFPEVPSWGGNDWARDIINAPEVWNQGITGKGMVVAVIDSGVDYTHPDLDSNILQNLGEIPNNGIDDDRNGYVDDVRGWDFVYNDNNPMDENIDGHGTHVAGAIAAERNNFGITGVAYNAKILPVRVLDSSGYGKPHDIAAGIRYAADNGANIINLSFGNENIPRPVEDDAIQYATDKGVVVVMAAGNDGSIQPEYPARDADRFGIAVGAINRNSTMPNFSDRAGSRPLDYLVAPGVDIYSTIPDNSYETYSGTSMATPHVAGVAALVLSANPTLTPGQVEYILTTTANLNGITV
jgi:Subtilase family/Bacterial pre-peptidase C-terminal domain